jgi:DNA-binding transcriptional LysR family regulator
MVEDLELRHLRYFVALAGTRHFGRAAETLHVTQPLLSRQIRSLEKLLGAPLLARTRPTVELTAAGLVLFEQAQQTLQQVERVARAARQSANGKQTVALAFEPCSSFHGFEPIIRKLHHGMPDLH